MENKCFKVLAVLVNYGSEQLQYLEQVVNELKSFKKFEVTVIVNSNIDLDIKGIDKVNLFTLDNYQLLPLTCRETIWENKDQFDLFVYGENDHLFLESHIDRHIKYSAILPKNRIPGLVQYEEENNQIYYPGYHSGFEWDFDTVEIYGNKRFAFFNNLHQATFILTKEQLLKVSQKVKFTELVNEDDPKLILFIKRGIKKIFKIDLFRIKLYSEKCKVNTDVFLYGGMKKMICISEFEDNLIHHLPNLYIQGSKGRKKFSADSMRMKEAINKLMTAKPRRKI
ncbi:hypothetical protein [Flavobacterium piscis]|uniref:Glycosyltransferase family 2 protein n=1 Tax=Flavobacterium piscis TaxID=1114874 RepID=A0ABU1Y408_9FLAO|nr:hypothetical protein [Flavobacterium piscis]MDR7208959.1 hypothetical protein [Flavobacterium piscis]